jgi:hypothetical protein
MIALARSWALGSYARRRRRAFETMARRAVALQEATLLRLVATASHTKFGLVHGFGGIRSVDDYQRRVPVREYGEFRPLWQRALEGRRR